MAAKSPVRFWRTAAKIPIGTPAAIASSSAQPPSSSETGSAPAMISRTWRDGNL